MAEMNSHTRSYRKTVAGSPTWGSRGLAAGADGLIVEAHPDPLNAFSDAAQQLESGKFSRFLADLAPWIDLARKERSAPSPT